MSQKNSPLKKNTPRKKGGVNQTDIISAAAAVLSSPSILESPSIYIHPQLGHPWSFEELNEFLNIVKKGNKPDWKTVIKKFPQRSIDMLENLYIFSHPIEDYSNTENLDFFVRGIFATEKKKEQRMSTGLTPSISPIVSQQTPSIQQQQLQLQQQQFQQQLQQQQFQQQQQQQQQQGYRSSRGRRIVFNNDDDKPMTTKNTTPSRRLFSDMSPQQHQTINTITSPNILRQQPTTTTTTTTSSSSSPLNTPNKRKKITRSNILSPTSALASINMNMGDIPSSPGNLPAKLKFKQGKIHVPSSPSSNSNGIGIGSGSLRIDDTFKNDNNNNNHNNNSNNSSMITPSEETQSSIQKRLINFLSEHHNNTNENGMNDNNDHHDDDHHQKHNNRNQNNHNGHNNQQQHKLSKSGIWATYEWFYSDLDAPFYFYNEFQVWLNQIGIGRFKKLTNVEWNVIRSKMKKPRRLSQQFFIEAREKLEQTRNKVRHSMMNDESFKFLQIQKNSKVLYLNNNQVEKGITIDYNELKNSYSILPENDNQIVEVSDTVVMSLEKNIKSIIESTFYLAQPSHSGHHGGGSGVRKRTTEDYIVYHDENLSPVPPNQNEENNHILVLILGLIVVLEKKESILGQIAQMNEKAKEFLLVGYPSQFQIEYSQVLLGLEYLNTILEGLLEIFRTHFRFTNKLNNNNNNSNSNQENSTTTDQQQQQQQLSTIDQNQSNNNSSVLLDIIKSVGNKNGEEEDDNGESQLLQKDIYKTQLYIMSELIKNQSEQFINQVDNDLVNNSNNNYNNVNSNNNNNKKEQEYLTNILSHEDPLKKLMVCCISFLFNLKQTCVNTEFSEKDISFIFDTCLYPIKPKSKENQIIFDEIQQSIEILRRKILSSHFPNSNNSTTTTTTTNKTSPEQ